MTRSRPAIEPGDSGPDRDSPPPRRFGGAGRKRPRASAIYLGALLASGLLVASPALPAAAQGETEVDAETCTYMGQDVVVAARQELACDVVVFGGSLIVEDGAFVDGSVAVLGGDVEVAGRVAGDVYGTGDLVLRSSAEIGGDASAIGSVEAEAGAGVSGTARSLRRLDPESRVWRARSGEGWRLPLFGASVTVALAALFAALAWSVLPGALGNVRHAAGSRSGWLASIAVGLLAIVLFPILVVITVVTIVLPLFVVAAYALALTMGAVALGALLGDALLPRLRPTARAAAGMALLSAVWAIPMYGAGAGWRLWCAGALLGWFLSAWAIGSAVVSRFGTRGPFPLSGPAPVSDRGPEDPPAGASDLTVPSSAGLEDHRPGAEAYENIEASGGGGLGYDAVAPAGDQGEEWAELADEAVAQEEAGPASVGFWSSPQPQGDVLNSLPGMTPVYAQLLRDAGLSEMTSLAAATLEEIRGAVDRPDVLQLEDEALRAWRTEARYRAADQDDG